MKIQTLIEIYDHSSGNFISEIDISGYELEDIRRIAPPKVHDPCYYDPYELGKVQLFLLQKMVPELAGFPYEKYAFCIQARSVTTKL